ncbi:MAG: hypothetical protein GF346_11250 [Candidatus Eisenbacteria bacterium]|nr:hypothetical protein [Candidatus Latescibacterota bacterium]MBD3303011.1 hypothetical protein [Candidatus Eisenbacteria bacterium]
MSGERDRARPHEDPTTTEIRREAERICALILFSDLPLIDVQIAASALRRKIRALQPENVPLYERIYAPRFRRLWEQWRGGEPWK